MLQCLDITAVVPCCKANQAVLIEPDVSCQGDLVSTVLSCQHFRRSPTSLPCSTRQCQVELASFLTCSTSYVSQVADVAVVTATRDGMNLVPYEYVVCRQGPPGWADADHKPQSMLVVSGIHCYTLPVVYHR